MLYWIIFYILQILILFAAETTTNTKRKKWLYVLSALYAIYFSAFRDGLGQDYSGYIEKLQWEQDITWQWDSELIFQFISYIIESTNFSEVFYFLICAVVTIGCIWNYLTNANNKFIFTSVLLFLVIPGMFFNTFNLTRQYFATAIFLYSIKYIETKNILKYSLCIIVATMMHTSAIVLWPLYFILNRRYSLIRCLLLGGMGALVAVNIRDIIQSMDIFSKYEVYVDSNTMASASSTIMILCIVTLCIEFIHDKFHKNYSLDNKYISQYTQISMNMFALYILFSGLSLIDFFFFRLSIYFAPSICIIIPYVWNKIFKEKAIVMVLCFCISIFYFVIFIVGNVNNPIICPDEILPLKSLFD